MRRLLMLLALLAPSLALADTDDDRVTASRLLFGGGLLVEGDAARGVVKISYDPKAGLDDARVRKLIADYLEGPLFQTGSSPSFNADYQLNLVRYRGGKGNAWVLLEPKEKRSVCIAVAEDVRDEERRNAAVDWCWWEAARTARMSLHDFNGQPVESKLPARGTYAGKLRFTDTLWQGPEIQLVVPGLPLESAIQAMRVQQNLLSYIPEENRYLAQAKRLKAQNAEWIKGRVAAVKALEAKQASKQVVFGRRWFGPWDPVEAVASVESCQDVYWKAFASPKVKEGEVHVWQMSVDGTVCATDFIQGEWIARGGPFFSGNPDDCSPLLVTAGKHTLEVALLGTKDQKTGTWSFDRNDTSWRQNVRSVTTRPVARGKLTCENPSDLAISRE